MAEIQVESFQNTNFEFDIEANRRRRAEIANDVNELINISKFFLQNYSEHSPRKIPTNIPITKPITKCEKNSSNEKKVRIQTMRNGRLCNQIKKASVANVTPTIVKRKQKSYGMTPTKYNVDEYDDMPPLFDKIKLHEYCVEIVDRFFHGTPNNESETNGKPTTERNEPSRATAKGMGQKHVQMSKKSNGNSVRMKINPKYASISSRYMNESPQRMTIGSSPKTPPITLVSAKSREILEKKARTGVEVKKHSCLLHQKEDTGSKQQTKRNININSSPPMVTFSQIHPNIELVPSNSMFPKRVMRGEGTHENKPVESISIEDGTDQMGTSIEHDEEENEIVEKEQQDNEANAQPTLVPDKKDAIHLQLQPLPALSIKAIPKCEIENLFEIEIKPKAPKADVQFEWNNRRVVEFMHESSGGELSLHDKIEVQDNLGSRQKTMTSSASVTSGQPNRYLEPGDHRNGLSVVNAETTTTENRITTDDTYDGSYLESGPSLNLSTISHMTDDEKFHSDQKLLSKMIDSRKPIKTSARKVIDEILENNSSGAEPEKSSSTYNFDDLRQILQKIRDDKTALDLAAPKLDTGAVGLDQQSLLASRRSQSTQCDYSPTDSSRISKTESEPIKYRIIDMPAPNGHLLQSPKFHKTIESICSSARRLDFNESLYKTATQEQITRAANKFLASILKNGDNSQSDDKNSAINCLRTRKSKYQIVDDRIINSDFNHAIDFAESTENTTSASELPSLTMRLNLGSDRRRSSHSQASVRRNNNNVWDDRSESNNFTAGSIDLRSRYGFHEIQDFSDLSDGEIPSEGEIFVRPN